MYIIIIVVLFIIFIIKCPIIILIINRIDNEIIRKMNLFISIKLITIINFFVVFFGDMFNIKIIGFLIINIRFIIHIIRVTLMVK